MVTQEALRGYVLEEFIARLVKDSGYDLLVHHSQDPFALTTKSNELNILGRGAPHQVDVLGQLRTQIPLTYPLRLFIEVKFRNGKTGLATLRNALGVLNDVNEHYSWRAANDASSTARYDYRYAIFSTSGFTNDAIQYAVTQRLSLGDLSTPAFRWLRDAADSTATAILKLASKNKQGTFRVRQVRIALRRAFATMPPGLPPSRFKDGLPQTELRKIAHDAAERIDNELYVGFATDSPFIVFLQPDEPQDANAFLNEQIVDRQPERPLTLARSGPSEWLVTTDNTQQPMTLRLAIPEGLARWVVAEPVNQDIGNLDAISSPQPPRPRPLLIAAMGGELAEVTFEPAPRVRPLQDPTSFDPGEPWRRPDLAYRDEGSAEEPGGSPWNPDAFSELIRLLRQEDAVQSAVIEYAARHHGRITRARVYALAAYEQSRSLKGFTRPARRITKRLVRAGLLPADAKWPLQAYYAGHAVRATHLVVPTEFTEFIHQLDN